MMMIMMMIIDRLLTPNHRTTNWDLFALALVNLAMYALLFLVACKSCGFDLDPGVLTALVAGTLTVSTPYYLRIALGRRDEQDPNVSKQDTD